MSDRWTPAEGLAELVRGEVVDLDEVGVRVRCSGSDGPIRVCDQLETSDTRLTLQVGDDVLCWLPTSLDPRGVVLGRITPKHGSNAKTPAAELPDELVFEAQHSLTLRVGDGSITIREDGKILIKGKDLVSHARRLNRIKGGAVQIN